jgi:ATP-dependent DNA helicase PIF1
MEESIIIVSVVVLGAIVTLYLLLRKSGGKPSFILTEEFQRALHLMNNTNRSVFVTGKAGTGKSTLIRHFLKTTRKKCVVVAPTGVAALNIGGSTIHS